MIKRINKIRNFKIEFKFKVEDNLIINLPSCYVLDSPVITGVCIDGDDRNLWQREQKLKKLLGE